WHRCRERTLKTHKSMKPENDTNNTAGSDCPEASCYAFLVVDARVRYWEDAEVNGISDEEGDLIPLREDESWKAVIELATGRIQNWPEGTTADIHYKVCDDGDYWLANSEGEKLAKWNDGYVPDRFLAVGDRGYGDYIIMKVDAAGMIEGWAPPEIDPEEWEILGHNDKCSR
ncbi:hypothetical protein RZS08_18640, partial [Arthrospira platensis SPKY1]|nr:hypothetical protein [Arthrospira platensis SPKY1]